jgi:hypothetical protein
MSPEENTPDPGAVVIYGASDNLIEIKGQVRGCDEYNAEDAQFVLTGAHEDGLAQTRLRVVYLPKGVWAISVAPVSEDVPMLPVFISQERYSAKATIAGVGSIVREAL